MSIKKDLKVYAVVVTFNRKKYLGECLDGLSRQTRKIDGIIIVNNASTDGTEHLLYEKGLIENLPEEKSPKIQEFQTKPFLFDKKPTTIICMNENIGGSGGFHEGLKKAYLEGADWIWLMDDDVEPDANCLAGLLSFSSISKCIHPRKYFNNGIPHNWEGYYDIKTGRRIYQKVSSFQKGFSFCTTNTGCFEGMLIHRSIVDAIGFPDKRFFIGMDDSLYGFRAHFHTPVLYVRDPFIRKKANAPDSNTPISDRNIYYGMRNAFLFYFAFNELIPEYKWSRTLFLGIKFIDYAFNILQSKKNKLTGYRALIKGLRDGLIGQFGKEKS